MRISKKDRVKFIQDTLNELYPTTLIPLQHKDAYTLLIAVLLSAQCTDERVNKITPALFELADNPYDMSKVPVDQIREKCSPNRERFEKCIQKKRLE